MARISARKGLIQSRSSTLRAAIAVTIAGVISSGHHVYGAFAYETPWRLVVSLWIPAFVLLILSMLFVLRRYTNRSATTAATWIVLLGGVIFQAGVAQLAGFLAAWYAWLVFAEYSRE